MPVKITDARHRISKHDWDLSIPALCDFGIEVQVCGAGVNRRAQDSVQAQGKVCKKQRIDRADNVLQSIRRQRSIFAVGGRSDRSR